ncbi:methylated-DNA--[protein]-cysteine S-methyltransferase [Ramlibacter tataouinensis]|uniref:methylated-DNA--[protein]-cysteine S-methyltransferase n=1 Tax=Ramlibacter tataouinensis TaxID=94132 RepID=UPI0022F3E7F6|nr:methylated-DNA--[protein]-cysteine S-methyltransferase [Ramlibacter tataouinensis]WBY01286.1 methylated-DNA--[protein]-cysteine S-methyltransferase [Ramlibacter tataouinensis]
MKFDPSLVAARHSSPLGGMLLAATDRGLAGLWFDGQRHHPDAAGWRFDPAHPVLVRTMRQLDEYFAGRRTTFDLPLDLQGGTPFQQSVWQALLRIPCGERRTYGQLGAGIGRSTAVRAVGAAVGRNPVCIVVPCHRVLGADGSLTGYAGGLERKTALLRIEGLM